MRIAFALALAAPALAGCGTVYTPRPSPRIQLVQDGNISLAKNGKIHAIGILGSDLEEVVRGSPRAEEEAKSFHGKMVGGFVLGLGGTIATGIGAGVIAYNEANSQSTDPRIIGVSLALGGVALAIVSATLTGSAQKHLFNAINMYNDDLPPPYGYGAPRAIPGIPQPGSSPFQPSLQPGYAPQWQPGYAPQPSLQPGLAPQPGSQPGLAPQPGSQPGLAPQPGGQPGFAPPAAPAPVAPPSNTPPPAPKG